MSYLLGIDIGSVNAKLALVDERGKLLRLDTEKVTSSPRAALSALISRLSQEFNLEDIVSAGVSGSGRAVIPRELNWAEYGSPLSPAAGFLHYYPYSTTILHDRG